LFLPPKELKFNIFPKPCSVARRLSASLDGKSEVQKVQSICELNQAACAMAQLGPMIFRMVNPGYGRFETQQLQT
jgi:hypothetical protein